MTFDLLVLFSSIFKYLSLKNKDEKGDRDPTRRFFIRCCRTSNAISLFVPRCNAALREIEFFESKWLESRDVFSYFLFLFYLFFFFFKYDRAWCECFIAVMTRCNICCTWTFRRYWYCIIFELGGSDDLFLARYNFSLSLLNKKGNIIQVDEQEVSYFRRNLVYLRPRKREKESMDEWACE